MIKSNVLRRNKKMTLIIAAKSRDGIVMVSDTKVVDDTTGEVFFEEKLKSPVENESIIIGAAGHSHLFKQFSRKIAVVVKQKVRETKIKNIRALKEQGLNIPDYDKWEKENSKPDVPYHYTAEDFLDDCKNLIKTLCSNGGQLEVLISMFAYGEPRLHHIDSQGEEEEIGFCAIGTGTPFVELFKKSYSPRDSLREVATILSFMVMFVSYAKIDNYVGIEEGKLPDIKAIENSGAKGTIEFTPEGEKEILDEFKSRAETLVDFCNLNKPFNVVFRKI